MRAVLISAGQGTRLIPLTLNVPKCLVPVGGRTILDWQLDAFHNAGVTDIVIIGGYKAPLIEAHIAPLPDEIRPRLIVNPFWSVSSSIGSVWMARGVLDAPFCLLNGDTLVTPALLSEALKLAEPGVNLVVEHAPDAGQDDMRVAIEAGRVRRVGKDLPADVARYRSLGMIICQGGGSREYLRALDDIMHDENGPLRYHHDVIDLIAGRATVMPVVIGNHDWLEIDRPDDIAFWKWTHGDDAAS